MKLLLKMVLAQRHDLAVVSVSTCVVESAFRINWTTALLMVILSMKHQTHHEIPFGVVRMWATVMARLCVVVVVVVLARAKYRSILSGFPRNAPRSRLETCGENGNCRQDKLDYCNNANCSPVQGAAFVQVVTVVLACSDVCDAGSSVGEQN
jgi:hypothetical protein